MATNLPSCFFIQFLEQLLKLLVNFTLLKYVKSQKSHGFLITKELIFGFQILDLKDHFSASLMVMALIEIFCSYLVNKMEICLSHHWSHSLLHYSVTFNISRQKDLKDHFSASLEWTYCFHQKC